MVRKTREEKAITLIALIITIVVLLILAVVAINAVTGDGIIQHATNAKTEYEKAQAEENSMLSYYEQYLESQGGADIWDGKTSQKPEIKDGNWYIYNCSEFKFFADFVNGTLTKKEGIEEITGDTTVYLMSNLDLGARQTDGKLTEGTAWEPIGIDSNKSFIGTFEGNNHYIKGVYVKQEADFAGLFGYTTNTINNLTVKDGYIEAFGTGVGGIVGRGKIIINCHNINTTVKQTSGYYIGGITGQANQIEKCTNTGVVVGTGDGLNGSNVVGGIVGNLSFEGIIKKCKNSGAISGTGKVVGGIVGNSNGNSIIENCVNTKMVTGEENVGGIIGTASTRYGYNYLELENCYNKGEIIGECNIGGIVGDLLGTDGKIRGCYNIGIIEKNENYGSIIGYIENNEGNTIEKCYYLGETTDTATGEMVESEMKTKTFADKLNLATNTEAWIGNDGQYPKLSWE